jgi:hypothetical protein
MKGAQFRIISLSYHHSLPQLLDDGLIGYLLIIVLQVYQIPKWLAFLPVLILGSGASCLD